jgi:hypothetical protein
LPEPRFSTLKDCSEEIDKKNLSHPENSGEQISDIGTEIEREFRNRRGNAMVSPKGLSSVCKFQSLTPLVNLTYVYWKTSHLSVMMAILILLLLSKPFGSCSLLILGSCSLNDPILLGLLDIVILKVAYR